MHPAKSVIFFTTATGAGYGLLVALFAYSLLGEAPADNSFTWGAFFSAFFLIIAGLLSSTLHLGHPERAWRALSQWRSSWLSREGVAALFTFIPAGLFLYSWLTFGMTSIYTFLFGALTAILSLATVYCTAMIYVSLKAIPAWRNLWTLPVYLSFSIMTGTVLFNFLIELFDTALPSLTPAIFPYQSQFNWIHDLDYSLPNQRDLAEEREKITNEYQDALTKHEEKANQNHEKYQFLNDLLTATGDALVSTVEEFLGYFKFSEVRNMDELNPDKLEEDLQVDYPDGLLVIEAKGVGGTSTDSDCQQISKFRFRRAQERNSTDVFALYIVNHQR
ncbi:MAG: dimethyl sulfoxide reductase anchor subunit [Proteobacteria bacterium]|nr:dimethyl sulfoxide reductase anchor subunit [Pseudomonadota bacterium]